MNKVIVTITVAPNVDKEALNPNDQECFESIVGKHEFPVSMTVSPEQMRKDLVENYDFDCEGMSPVDVRCNWALEQAWDEYHETPIKVLDDFDLKSEVKVVSDISGFEDWSREVGEAAKSQGIALDGCGDLKEAYLWGVSIEEMIAWAEMAGGRQNG